RLADGRPCRYAVLALGKLGGREMSYHSDLDLVLVYEGDGRTEPEQRTEDRGQRTEDGGQKTEDRPTAGRSSVLCPLSSVPLLPEPTDNLHYFSELARRVIRQAAAHGPMGRLYAVDMRLRPTGGSGSLAVSLAEFERYYAGGGAQPWERQALTR